MHKLTIKNLTKSTLKTKFKELPVGAIFTYTGFLYLKIMEVLGRYYILGNCVNLVTNTTFVILDNEDVTPCKAQLEFEEVKGDT